LNDTLRQKEIEREALKRQQPADLNELDEMLAAQRKKLERLRRRADALELAINTLDEAVREYQEQHLVHLAERASHIFTAVTLGRYERVDLSDDFTPSTIGPGRGATAVESLRASSRVFTISVMSVRKANLKLSPPSS